MGGGGDILSNEIFVFIIKLIYLNIQVVRGVICTSLINCFFVVNENGSADI